VRITVRVKPNSRAEGITGNPDGSLTISVKAPPVAGAANEAVVSLLARFFQVPKSSIRLVRGGRSRLKVFEVGS
jgi:uncharacterized protein (TIGR00251 family)